MSVKYTCLVVWGAAPHPIERASTHPSATYIVILCLFRLALATHCDHFGHTAW